MTTPVRKRTAVPYPFITAVLAYAQRHSRVLLVIASALLLSAPFVFAREVISFRHLAPGEAIHVRFTSCGCFHRSVYEFDFQRTTALMVKVTQAEGFFDDVGEPVKSLKRSVLGTVALTDEEAAGLDRLFKFYRTAPDGACTTEDEITATRTSGHTVKASESFTDATCATYRLKDVTLLTSIAAKLQSEGRVPAAVKWP